MLPITDYSLKSLMLNEQCMRTTARGVFLQADNPAFPPLHVGTESDFTVWGVATICLHQLGNQRVLRHAG